MGLCGIYTRELVGDGGAGCRHRRRRGDDVLALSIAESQIHAPWLTDIILVRVKLIPLQWQTLNLRR